MIYNTHTILFLQKNSHNIYNSLSLIKITLKLKIISKMKNFYISTFIPLIIQGYSQNRQHLRVLLLEIAIRKLIIYPE